MNELYVIGDYSKASDGFIQDAVDGRYGDFAKLFATELRTARQRLAIAETVMEEARGIAEHCPEQTGVERTIESHLRWGLKKMKDVK